MDLRTHFSFSFFFFFLQLNLLSQFDVDMVEIVASASFFLIMDYRNIYIEEEKTHYCRIVSYFVYVSVPQRNVNKRYETPFLFRAIHIYVDDGSISVTHIIFFLIIFRANRSFLAGSLAKNIRILP